MSLIPNRRTFQALIDEDIELLRKEMPKSLERDHIEGLLRDLVGLYYDEIPAGFRRWVDTYRDNS